VTLQVFISYKSEYRDFARAVKGELNEWGYETWLDVDNIQPGDYFRHKIQEGLDGSDVLLMVLTEEAQLSREVMAEVDYFLDVAKKPVVPLRHRECKPLYIFVSIQYIDFVTDQANGFVQLKQRLTELAELPTEAKSGAAPEPEPMIEEAEEIILDDFLREKSDQKKESLEDGLFGAPDLSTADAPKPQPMPPPKPITSPITPPGSAVSQPVLQPPSSPITQLIQPPSQPIIQPQRQAEYMPQPAAARSKSSRTLLWPIAAVASLIVVVGAVVLLSTNATVSTTQSTQGTSPLIWIIGGLVVVGAAGYIGWQRINARKGLRPFPTEDTQNRATMLQKVEDFWLKGVLDPALEAGTFEMGLSAAPGAVLRHKDYGDYELPANANILNVFNDLNRELLILGAPGGGKTVLLLQLAKALIEQAKNPTPQSPPRKQGGEEPIPVVFNLSSWAAERKPLGDWLVDELRQKYQVPKKVATAWVEGEKLLLLLDGLDEVAEQYRNDCVDAINAFRQHYRTVDLAICSRVADYDALTIKLDVRGAIVLEPLNQTVIDMYLDRPELASLRQVMVNDQELQAMSRVPFLLNAMAYAYAGATQTNLQFPASDNPAKARQKHLFDRWIEKRLVARPSTDYTPSRVRQWLGWLASKMVTFEMLVFYIQMGLQSKWLTKNRGFYKVSAGLAGGLALGLVAGLMGLVAGLMGLVTGLAFGLLFGLMGLLNGLPLRLVFGLVFGPEGGLPLGLAFGRALGLAFGPLGLLMVVIGNGDTIIDYLILRLYLWKTGVAPWNYARFLDYCMSTGIMRKVGGGYIFAHRYLMEYFAESYQEEEK